MRMHGMEGGTTIWMNDPDQAQYWSDESYVLVTNYPPLGAKVHYTANDHSAITIYPTGYFSSKWGAA